VAPDTTGGGGSRSRKVSRGNRRSRRGGRRRQIELLLLLFPVVKRAADRYLYPSANVKVEAFRFLLVRNNLAYDKEQLRGYLRRGCRRKYLFIGYPFIGIPPNRGEGVIRVRVPGTGIQFN